MEVIAIEISEFSICSTGWPNGGKICFMHVLWPILGDNNSFFTLLTLLGVAKIFHPSLTSDVTAGDLNCLLAGNPDWCYCWQTYRCGGLLSCLPDFMLAALVWLQIMFSLFLCMWILVFAMVFSTCKLQKTICYYNINQPNNNTVLYYIRMEI